MADSTPNPGQGSSGKGIFQTPFGNAVTGPSPITSGGAPKVFDYGNATAGFETPSATYGDSCGGGIIQGPGCAKGDQKR